MGYKDPKDVRTKMVHISFSENEYNEIDEYVKESSLKTRTAFIRDAIEEKINRIKNPELFMTKTANNGKIEDFLNEVRGLTETQNKIVEQLADLNELKTSLATLSTLVKTPETMKNEKTIVDILKKHKHLKPNKIMELTKLSQEEVIEAISNANLFTYNINGDVELK